MSSIQTTTSNEQPWTLGNYLVFGYGLLMLAPWYYAVPDNQSGMKYADALGVDVYMILIPLGVGLAYLAFISTLHSIVKTISRAWTQGQGASSSLEQVFTERERRFHDMCLIRNAEIDAHEWNGHKEKAFQIEYAEDMRRDDAKAVMQRTQMMRDGTWTKEFEKMYQEHFEGRN